jgi:hypothetical protein
MGLYTGETVSLPEVVVPEKLFISHSLTRDWKACRRKFFWNYLARLTPRKISIPYFVGSHFHMGMEHFYAGEDPDKFIPGIITSMEEKAKKAVFLSPEEEEKLMLQSAIVTGMLRGYTKTYAKDLKKWKVVGRPEKDFVIPIAGDTGLAYVGQIDLIVRFEGKLWIVEHKTAGRLDKNYIDRLALDTQITGYSIGAKFSLKEPVAGVVYNVAKKPQIRQKKDETKPEFAQRIEDDYMARPEFYFYRETLFRDAGAATEYKAEVSEMAADMQDNLAAVKKLGAAKALPRFYRNTDHCTARGPCPYLDICKNGWSKDMASRFIIRDKLNPELDIETDGDED